jgi:hypothetical protein
VYPTLAAATSLLALCMSLTRAADSSAVIGISVWLSVAELLIGVGLHVLVALGVYSHTRLALSVTRLYLGRQLGLSRVLHRLRVVSAVFALATLVLWLPVCTVLLLSPGWDQQVTLLLFTLTALPSWLLGVVHVVTTRRIQSTLMTGAQKLSQAQREARQQALARIGGHSCGARLAMLLHLVGSILGSCWPALRQYAELLLFVQWTTLLIIVHGRLSLLSTTSTRGAAVAATDETNRKQPAPAVVKPLMSPSASHSAMPATAGAAHSLVQAESSAADSRLQLPA